MKILIVSDTFPPRKFGGVTTISYLLAKKLVERGHNVVVYTTDVGDSASSRLNVKDIEIINGLKVYYFKNISNSLAFKHRLFLPLGMTSAIKNSITNFDIIHFHGYRSFLGIIIHHYAKKYKIPYVLQAHGSILPSFQKQRLKKLYDVVWGYRILHDASKVIALTKTEAEQYRIMGVNKDKIKIVPNGINLSEYDYLPKRGEFRRKYGIRDNENMILYIGRIHITKGIDLLVKAFADLAKELNDVKLVLVGPDDGYQSVIEDYVRTLKVNDKVLFTGFVNNKEKIAAFADADVFVTPSFLGFPVTFLEACACGTPIITTRNGDELDWIHDRVGYVVEYNKEQLQDAMSKILRDEGLRRRFGEEGKRLVREEFSWDKVVKKVEEVYMGCL